MKKALITGITGQDGHLSCRDFFWKKVMKFMVLFVGLLQLILLDLITFIQKLNCIMVIHDRLYKPCKGYSISTT
jgi:hypothetical protein